MTATMRYVCDRCEQETSYEDRTLLSVVATPGKTPTSDPQCIDLCPGCVERFRDFMACRPVKGLLKIVYSEGPIIEAQEVEYVAPVQE